MVNLISKISKGTLMDQIYVPKQRSMQFQIGSYVLIKPLEVEKKEIKPFFFNVKNIEPIKVEIVKNIFEIINDYNPDNIIITGSFLEEGFRFNDIDVLIITDKTIDKNEINNKILTNLGLLSHIIAIPFKELIEGANTDPLYQLMLTKYVSTKRIMVKLKNKINYKILDLHLLKSKTMIDNFDFLTGKEKYDLIRNLISIELFLKEEKLSKEKIDKTIEKTFGISTENIKNNIIANRNIFIKKYKQEYDSLSKKILEGIKNDSKQKEGN